MVEPSFCVNICSNAQISHAGELTKQGTDVQGQKEDLSGQLQAPRKWHKPRNEKIRSVRGVENQKIMSQHYMKRN